MTKENKKGMSAEQVHDPAATNLSGHTWKMLKMCEKLMSSGFCNVLV